MKSLIRFIKREKTLIILSISFLYFAITALLGFSHLIKVKMSKEKEFVDKFVPLKDDFLRKMKHFKAVLEGNERDEKIEVKKDLFERFEGPSDNNGSNKKIECWNCGRLIPYTSVLCPYCKAIQRHADTDGDGMPNYWELRYKLNPDDPADAMEDFDEDGYTNLEEYKAGSDPTNPKETPINKKNIFQVIKIYRKPVDILFRGYIELNDSFTLEINWEERGKTFFLEVGDEIRGYIILEFHKVIEDKRIDKKGIVVEEDKSYIILQRKGTNEKIKLVKNKVYIAREVYARLINRVTKDRYDVHVGSKFETTVDGEKIKFVVINITLDQVFLKAEGKGDIIYHFDWR